MLSQTISVHCRDDTVTVPRQIASKMAFIEGVIEDLDPEDSKTLQLSLANLSSASVSRLVCLYLDEASVPFSHLIHKTITAECLADKIDDICTAAFLQIPEQDLEALVCQVGKFIRECCSDSSSVLKLLDLDVDELNEDEILRTDLLLARCGIFGPFVRETDLDDCCSEHGMLSDLCWDMRRRIFENPWQKIGALCMATVHGTLALGSLERMNRRSPLQRMSEDLLVLLILFAGDVEFF
jgi:hypothetical protein